MRAGGGGEGVGIGMAASTKSFLADAGYGEQELDANSALMELDKGEARRAQGCRRPGSAMGAARPVGLPLRPALPAGACPGLRSAALFCSASPGAEEGPGFEGGAVSEAVVAVWFRPPVWQARGAVRSRRPFSQALPEIPFPYSH